MRERVARILSTMVLIILGLIIIGIVIYSMFFARNTFLFKTMINGTEVSFLSATNANKKLLTDKNMDTLTLLFADDKKYTCMASYFEFELRDKNIEILQNIISEQSKKNNDNTYDGLELFDVNETKVKEYLKSLGVFHETNVRKPQNAYLDFDSNNLLVIMPEVYGNEIDLDEACQYMINAIKRGKTTIDFRKITNITPNIVSTDEKLIDQKEKINSILSTTVQYQMPDGSTYTLDSSVMKEWVYCSDDGYYGIDIDNNLKEFVEELNAKAKYIIPSTKFNATDIGTIDISFGRKTYATINEDAEIERIKENLGSGQVLTWKPIYNALPDYTNLSTYVELDISRQTVWMYVNGECILETPCVTGSVASGHSTPVGIFHLTYKERNTYLTDGKTYNSFVHFWMPFNGDIGFHDADGWRSSYGGNIYMYNGSHGCVNLPHWAAEILYNNIDTSIPIILYS